MLASSPNTVKLERAGDSGRPHGHRTAGWWARLPVLLLGDAQASGSPASQNGFGSGPRAPGSPRRRRVVTHKGQNRISWHMRVRGEATTDSPPGWPAG